jgi:DNA-binding response OmpR family regulator
LARVVPLPCAMAEPRRRRVAVVNDDPDFLALVELLLESEGPYEVFTFRDEETRVGELRAIAPEVIVIDILATTLPTGWELAVVAGADATLGPIPIVVTSPSVPGLGHRVEELREVANVRVVPKPFTTDELRAAVHDALNGVDQAGRGSPEPAS